MIFDLTILGTSSATPTLERHPSGQVLNINGNHYLFDCGEGSQTQLMRYGIRANRIRNIFITHLHPDHYLGLIGLVCTFNLQHRQEELNIYGPPGIDDIVNVNLRHSEFTFHYPLKYHILNMAEPELLLDTKDVTVHSVRLRHRIPTMGFVLREKVRGRKINQEAVELAGLPVEAYSVLQQGEDYKDAAGKVYKNADYTFDPPNPRSFAYLTDTMYFEEVVSHIKDVDLLYHEATFMSDQEERARGTFHSTAAQAATIAKMAGAGKLVIGHYSARYNDIEPFLTEARAIFPNTELAIEGRQFKVQRSS